MVSKEYPERDVEKCRWHVSGTAGGGGATRCIK